MQADAEARLTRSGADAVGGLPVRSPNIALPKSRAASGSALSPINAIAAGSAIWSAKRETGVKIKERSVTVHNGLFCRYC